MCTLTSVLTNTSQLAQRIIGQPGRHSTGCVHRLAGQEDFSNEQETGDCGIRQTMQHLLVCPMMYTACSPQDLTTANGIAIGCAKHGEGTILRTYDSWWKYKNDDEWRPLEDEYKNSTLLLLPSIMIIIKMLLTLLWVFLGSYLLYVILFYRICI